MTSPETLLNKIAIKSIANAVNSESPAKNLVGLVAEWPSCSDRDCYHQSGMQHIQEALLISEDEKLQYQVADTIKDVLPGLPSSVADLITPGPDSATDRRYFRSLTTTGSVNILALAAVLKQPRLLADPLEKLVKNGEVMRLPGSRLIDHAILSAVSKYETDPVILLRQAVMLNQSDNRYQPDWMQMLADGRSDKFPTFSSEGKPDPVRYAREIAVWGLLAMPENSGRQEVLIEAGKTISQIPEYANPADVNDTYPYMRGQATRDRDFRKIFLWSVLDRAGFDETVLKDLLDKKDSLGWEKWAVDSLEYFVGAEYPPLSPLEVIYRKAALSIHLEKRIQELAEKEGIRSSSQPSSPEHTTLALIQESVDREINREIDSWSVTSRLQLKVSDRAIKEGWFPAQVKMFIG